MAVKKKTTSLKALHEAQLYAQQQRDAAAIAFVVLAEAGTIDAVTASEQSLLFAEWAANVNYTVGQLRQYGGKLYRVGITVPVDDESEKEFSYYFKRPTVPSYDRYIKTAAQGITKASKASMLDAVIDEDAERLTKDMEENPGIAISIGNKLTEILGLTGTANLKKL